jgi:competence protein ComEA
MLNGIRTYFSMSKWETLAAIVILALGILIWGANIFIPRFFKTKEIAINDRAVISKLIAQVQAAEADTTARWKRSSSNFAKSDGSNIKAFAFDPNTLDSNGWCRLGLTAKQVGTILNYRRKGGQFRDKADVQKMYSISEAEFSKLENYIAIKELPKKQYANNWNDKYPKTARQPIIVEINSADTAAFNKLYGIGPTLAFRIVEFRNKIGGFVSKEQIKEVYGITDSAFVKIKDHLILNKALVIRININTVLFQDLRLHPYFAEPIALALLKYRKNNQGKIENWEAIESIPEIDAAAKAKIKPYLTF